MNGVLIIRLIKRYFKGCFCFGLTDKRKQGINYVFCRYSEMLRSHISKWCPLLHSEILEVHLKAVKVLSVLFEKVSCPCKDHKSPSPSLMASDEAELLWGEVVLLLQSKIFPFLTYGPEAWLRITKAQYKAMEKIMAKAIRRIFSLPYS